MPRNHLPRATPWVSRAVTPITTGCDQTSCAPANNQVGHEPGGVLRDERVILADAGAGCAVADDPAADEGVAVAELLQGMKLLAHVG